MKEIIKINAFVNWTCPSLDRVSVKITTIISLNKTDSSLNQQDNPFKQQDNPF